MTYITFSKQINYYYTYFKKYSCIDRRENVRKFLTHKTSMYSCPHALIVFFFLQFITNTTALEGRENLCLQFLFDIVLCPSTSTDTNDVSRKMNIETTRKCSYLCLCIREIFFFLEGARTLSVLILLSAYVISLN